MCDTIYMRKDGGAFFGKNSDRACNEAHLIIRQPAKDYADGEMLKATYITIPQAAHTNACVLLKPHWIWGAEMGWNEHGLNIGNEAVFTKVKREEKDGLIGMDLLRLALERCKTANEAAELIISLIEKYGQGGNCGFGKTFLYDNAFLIADKTTALVLETAGRSWVMRNADEVQTISNCLSIHEDYEKCSGDVSGDFRKKNSNPIMTLGAGADCRREASRSVLTQSGSAAKLMIKALQSHKNDGVTINKSSTSSVCMHAGNGIGDQTTGSYCGEIGRVYYVTGSSFPCLSLFKPVSPKASILPENEGEALKYWLRREQLNRHIMSGNIDKAKYLSRRDELQRRFITLAESARDEAELDAVSAQCFKEDEEFVSTFLELASGKDFNIKGSPFFSRYWNKRTKELINEYSL